MKHLSCALGFHRFTEWIVHTEGPCVRSTSTVHVFRRCPRCEDMEHLFAKLDNGNTYRFDSVSGTWKPDLRAIHRDN